MNINIIDFYKYYYYFYCLHTLESSTPTYHLKQEVSTQLHGMLFQEIHRSAIATMLYRVKVCKISDKLHNWLFSLFMKIWLFCFSLLTHFYSLQRGVVLCLHILYSFLAVMAPCTVPSMKWVELCLCVHKCIDLIYNKEEKMFSYFSIIVCLQLCTKLLFNTELYGILTYV